MHHLTRQRNAIFELIAHCPRTLLLCCACLIAASTALAPAARAKSSDQWLSAHFKSHPLVGSIWNAKGERVDVSELRTAVINARFALLGEIHTNPDHHRLQAEILHWLVAAGRKPAVVVEMIPTTMQSKLDDYQDNGPRDASSLGTVLRWSKRGWPDWEIYRPIFAAALAADLRIVAGGIPRDRLRAFSRKDKYLDLVSDLELQTGLGDRAVTALQQTIHEAHCKLLPGRAIKPMVNVQRARDARLAKAVLSTDPKQGAILIAGAGHVRRDWAVANIIRQTTPDAKTVAIRFAEVTQDQKSLADYSMKAADLTEPFDFTFFTPRGDLKDHCAEMRAYMKKHKHRAKPAGR